MEYVDLSPFTYWDSVIPMAAIGWLDDEYGIQGGDRPAMTEADVERLTAASWRMTNMSLGFHECELCDLSPYFRGNGEYHYYLSDGITYAAPMMLLHYVEEHGYRTPVVFRSALRAAEEPCDFTAGLLDGDFHPEIVHGRDALMTTGGGWVFGGGGAVVGLARRASP